MKRAYLYKQFIAALFVALFFIGCKDENFTDGANTKDLEDEIEVTFSYSVPGMTGITTKAEDKYTTVTAISVIVYKVDDATGDELFAYHRGTFDLDDNTGSFKVRLAKSYTNERYTFDFIFNATVNVNNLLGSMTIGTTTREDAQQLMVRTGSFSPGSGVIPMWATTNQQHIVTHGMTFPTLKPVRAMAVIDIGLNMDDDDVAAGLDNFTMTAGYATYIPGTTYLIPEKGKFDFIDNKVTAPTTSNPSSQHQSAGIGITDVILGKIFVGEPDVNKPTSTSFPDRTFSVVIGGYYKDDPSTTHYFRLDIQDPSDPSKKLDILRNHRYRINILNVTGEGYSSHQLAAQNPATMSVVYELTVHQEGDINHIVYNGANYLGINQEYYECEGTDGTTGEIQVLTNYSGGWTLKVTDANGNTPSWISFDNTSGSADNKIASRFTLTENSGDPRMAFVTFTAGQLTITARIRQNGKWYISTTYTSPNIMLGEGDKYDVSVWGAVPQNLWVRAYSPDKDIMASFDTLYYNIAGLSTIPVTFPEEQQLEIMGNASFPMGIRQVQFQYSEDGGTTWVPFEQGPQGKGHFRLRSTGRIVALYNMTDDNGDPLDVSWAEAMGIDSETDLEDYIGSDYNPGHGKGFNSHNFGYSYYEDFLSLVGYIVYHNYDDVDLRKIAPFLPSPAVAGNPGTGYPINGELYRIKYKEDYDNGLRKDGKTGCAVYNEDEYGYADQYPKGRWRLPSIRELEEMADYADYIGDLPLIGPDDNYWSSTEYAKMSLRMQAIYFHFKDGAVIVDPDYAENNANYKARSSIGKKLRVRCVFVPDNWVAPPLYEREEKYFE